MGYRQQHQNLKNFVMKNNSFREFVMPRFTREYVEKNWIQVVAYSINEVVQGSLHD